MKMKPYWILPLLFVLLAASKDSSEDRSSSKERDRLVEGLMSKVEDLLPPPPSTACVNRSTEWSPEKKGKAAKNIFNTLLIGLPNPSEFTFEKLIAGAKCGGSDQAQIILHMKVKRTVVVNCPPLGIVSPLNQSFLGRFCKPKEKRNVYCSWIGTLENDEHNKTLGAACYQAKAISEEEEKKLEAMNICSEWQFADTQVRRLSIPEQLSSWSTDLLLYYPPTADLPGNKSLTGIEEKAPMRHKNPGGRKGIAGQGLMKKLGKTKMEIPIIIRSYNGTWQVLTADERDKSGIEGPLPMFHSRPTNRSELHEWKEPSADEYFYSLLAIRNETICSKEKLLKAIKRGRRVHNGHLPYPYETDNAWISAAIYLVKVSNESCFNHLNLNGPKNYFGYQWKTYDNSTLRTVQDVVNTVFYKRESKKITAASYRSLGKYLLFFTTATVIACVAFVAAGATTTLPLLILSTLVALLAAIFLEIYTRRWHRLLARTGEPFCSIGTTAETERSREHKNGHEKSEDETGLFSLAPVLRLYGTTGRCDRFIKRKDLIMRQKTEMQRRRLRTWRISYVTSSAVIAEVNEVKANGHIKEEKEDK
ncbi:hypothetical protein M513_11842 [Trichuris suis]|uniref:Uncharacterized protein n=1 Tax=Trichuris suis TaxID=68888 RepID=A0A085LQP3_9BILA|nr:hypothetical protein M513_11842 [Trichuris suis]